VLAALKIYPCEDDRRSKKIWSYCDCPAGVNGTCKHSAALLYKILDLENMGAETLEIDNHTPTPTGKLQKFYFNFLRVIWPVSS